MEENSHVADLSIIADLDHTTMLIASPRSVHSWVELWELSHSLQDGF